MKKIPLEVYHFAEDLRVMAHFLLRCESPKIFMPIRAIIDTGSPMTIIGPADIKRMRLSKIQLQKLEGRHKPINIGGGQIFTKVLEKAKLRFGNNLEVEMPINFPIKNEEKSIQPSLLGVDFLLKTKSKLVFDPTKKIAYLEMED